MFPRSLGLLICVLASSAVAGESETLLPVRGAVVLSKAKGPALLKQCSRGSPEGVSTFWTPDRHEIQRLERLLIKELRARAERGLPTPPAATLYYRQYIGFVREGVRLVYGNYFPMQTETPPSQPAVICDGGPKFWGIVFNPSTGHFEEPQFNGYL